MKIKDIMTKDPATVTPNATVRDIAIRVAAEGRDVNTPVSDVMTTGRLVTLQPGADVEDAMEKMADEQVRRIPLVDDRGMLVGIVAQADIVRKVRDDRKAERTVEKISEPSRRHAQ